MVDSNLSGDDVFVEGGCRLLLQFRPCTSESQPNQTDDQRTDPFHEVVFQSWQRLRISFHR